MRPVLGTPDAPRSALDSQGVEVGDHIFVSGLVGIDVTTGQVAGPTMQQQTRQALASCEAVLQGRRRIARRRRGGGIILSDPDDFAGMNKEWTAWFPVDPPARYAATLGAVVPGILV